MSQLRIPYFSMLPVPTLLGLVAIFAGTFVMLALSGCKEEPPTLLDSGSATPGIPSKSRHPFFY